MRFQEVSFRTLIARMNRNLKKKRLNRLIVHQKHKINLISLFYFIVRFHYFVVNFVNKVYILYVPEAKMKGS